MPKASFAGKDAEKGGGFGMQEGNAEVVNAVVAVVQYQPNSKTGEQAPPFICVQLELQKLDKDWNRIDEEETQKVEYGLGRNKLNFIAGQEDCQCLFHPGRAKDADDPEPKDLGHEVGTEGNSIWASNDGVKIHEKAKFSVFRQSLEDHGFKPEILGRGYAPDLVGLKAHFKTVTTGKFQADSKAQEKDVSCLVVDKIQQYPYEKKEAAGKAKPKAAAASAASAATAAKANGQEGDVETRNVALTTIKKVVGRYKGQESVARSEFQKHMLQQMTLDRVKVAVQKPVLDLVKDDDELVQLGSGAGFVLDPETNTLNFNVGA